LNTELSTKNKITATGSLAVPVLRYSFGIINWHQEELRKLDRKTRKLLTIRGQHHPKAKVDRLYILRKQGGRELSQLEEAYMKLMEYVDCTADPLTQTVRTHQHKETQQYYRMLETSSLEYRNREGKRKMTRKMDAWTIRT
jgi:hypothetical protein